MLPFEGQGSQLLEEEEESDHTQCGYQIVPRRLVLMVGSRIVVVAGMIAQIKQQ